MSKMVLNDKADAKKDTVIGLKYRSESYNDITVFESL